MFHVICTQLNPGHLGVRVGDGSRRSEEIVKKKKKKNPTKPPPPQTNKQTRIAPVNAIIIIIMIMMMVSVRPSVCLCCSMNTDKQMGPHTCKEMNNQNLTFYLSRYSLPFLFLSNFSLLYCSRKNACVQKGTLHTARSSTYQYIHPSSLAIDMRNRNGGLNSTHKKLFHMCTGTRI